MKIIKVVLCVLFTLILVACSPKTNIKTQTPDTVQSLVILPDGCKPIETVLTQCKGVVKSSDEVKKVLAVMGEQLKTASAAVQERSCRDALTFWQTACGVAQ